LGVVRALFDVVEHVIDRLFRVVASDGRFDICEELSIMFNGLKRMDKWAAPSGDLDRDAYITVSSKLELQLDRLFQPFKSPAVVHPVSNLTQWFRCCDRRQAEEFIHGLLRIVHLHLLRIVVFVFDSNIGGLVIFIVFVFKVIAVSDSVSSVSGPYERRRGGGLLLLVCRILHEIIVVRHFVEVFLVREILRECKERKWSGGREKEGGLSRGVCERALGTGKDKLRSLQRATRASAFG
jgi:hypothetical protein